MNYIPKYFEFSDFDQHGLPGSGKEHMDRFFLKKLDELVERYCALSGDTPAKGILRISSGYRSPEYNARVSKTGLTGPHTTGRAVDISCSGVKQRRVLKVALDMDIPGIGPDARSARGSRYVHIDYAREANDLQFWTY